MTALGPCRCGRPAVVRFDRDPDRRPYCWNCCPTMDALIVRGWLPMGATA